MTHERAFWFPAVRGLVRRPGLWPTAVRQLRTTVPRRWWRRPPFLPIPDEGYLRFRFETAYGSAAEPRPGDIVHYLEWCRDMRRAGRT